MTLRAVLRWSLAIGLGANGLYMLLAPESWYHFMPTVPSTGPFNPHFVRDIGCAYLVSGGAAAMLALKRPGGPVAALTMSAFLGLHALVHLWDAVAGRATLEHLAQDFLGVFLVPALLAAMAWRRLRVRAP